VRTSAEGASRYALQRATPNVISSRAFSACLHTMPIPGVPLRSTPGFNHPAKVEYASRLFSCQVAATGEFA
jgi:hypothetical protein